MSSLQFTFTPSSTNNLITPSLFPTLAACISLLSSTPVIFSFDSIYTPCVVARTQCVFCVYCVALRVSACTQCVMLRGVPMSAKNGIRKEMPII